MNKNEYSNKRYDKHNMFTQQNFYKKENNIKNMQDKQEFVKKNDPSCKNSARSAYNDK